MDALVNRYAARLRAAGLARAPLVCGLDDTICWNRDDADIAILEEVMAGLNIASLVCAEPAEPHRTILRYLTGQAGAALTPRDCETRTFLHDLPVGRAFTAETILARLRQRKSVIIADGERLVIITFGSVSPEQAFVTFSSVCFAAFVLFFSELLAAAKNGTVSPARHAAAQQALALLAPPRLTAPPLLSGPFTSAGEVHAALIEAGRLTVDYELVDSYFGNISYRLGNTVYISQTGSSLDALAGCIDPCPLDDSSCAGITASSELSAHNEIYLRTDNRAILHGHPRFAVILSMDCDEPGCPDRGFCHIRCPRSHAINGIPVVPGEVGTGPTGLCHTLPPAMVDRPGVIVWGHGLFTVGRTDFNEAFSRLLAIENMCRAEYLARLQRAGCCL